MQRLSIADWCFCTLRGFFRDQDQNPLSEGKPNIEAREDIKIIDIAPIVRAIEGEPEAADLVQRRWSCAATGITAAQQKGRPKPPKLRNCGRPLRNWQRRRSRSVPRRL